MRLVGAAAGKGRGPATALVRPVMLRSPGDRGDHNGSSEDSMPAKLVVLYPKPLGIRRVVSQ